MFFRIKQLMAFVSVWLLVTSAIAGPRMPGGNNGGNAEQEIEGAVDALFSTISMILSSIFGLVAFVSFALVGFTWLKDKEAAKEMLYSWVGGVGLFSLASTLVAAMFAAFS